MNLGHGEIIDDEPGPPHIDANINEHAQLWHYRAWAEWMAADCWQDLKANHSAVPTGRISRRQRPSPTRAVYVDKVGGAGLAC